MSGVKHLFHHCEAQKNLYEDVICQNFKNTKHYLKFCEVCDLDSLNNIYKTTINTIFFSQNQSSEPKFQSIFAEKIAIFGNKKSFKKCPLNLIKNNENSDEVIIVALKRKIEKLLQANSNWTNNFFDKIFSEDFIDKEIFEYKENKTMYDVADCDIDNLKKNMFKIYEFMGSFNDKIVLISSFFLRFYKCLDPKEIEKFFLIEKETKNGGIFFGLDSKNYKIRITTILTMYILTTDKIIAKHTLKYLIDCFYDIEKKVRILAVNLVEDLSCKFKISIREELSDNLLRFNYKNRNLFFIEKVNIAISNFVYKEAIHFKKAIDGVESIKVKEVNSFLKNNTEIIKKYTENLFTAIFKNKMLESEDNNKRVKLDFEKIYEDSFINFDEIPENIIFTEKIEEFTSFLYENINESNISIIFLVFSFLIENYPMCGEFLIFKNIKMFNDYTLKDLKIILKEKKDFNYLFKNLDILKNFDEKYLRDRITTFLLYEDRTIKEFEVENENSENFPFFYNFYRNIYLYTKSQNFDNLKYIYNFSSFLIFSKEDLAKCIKHFGSKIFSKFNYDFYIQKFEKIKDTDDLMLSIKSKIISFQNNLFYKIEMEGSKAPLFYEIKDVTNILIPKIDSNKTIEYGVLKVTLLKQIEGDKFFNIITKTVFFPN